MLTGLETAEMVVYSTYDGGIRGDPFLPAVYFDRSFTKSLVITPHYEDSQRGPTYLSVELTIEGVLSLDDAWLDSAGSTPSGQIRAGFSELSWRTIQESLSVSGGTLLYRPAAVDPTQGGYTKKLFIAASGNKYVSSGGFGKSRTLNFGPKARLATWRPIGHGQKAVELKWVIQFDCFITNEEDYNSSFPGFPLIYEKNYTCQWSYDSDGFASRSISGYIDFVGFLNGKNQVIVNTATPNYPESADDYRGLVNIQRLSGFERSYQFSVSPSKTRLIFSVSDIEIKTVNPYPVGVSKISGRHSAKWSLADPTISQTISVTMARLPEMPQYYYWQLFRSIISGRLNIHTDEGLQFAKDAPYMLTELTIDEDLFGLETSFQASYYQPTTLQELLRSSRMWTPVVLNQVANPYNTNTRALFAEGMDWWTSADDDLKRIYGRNYSRQNRTVPLMYISADEIVLNMDAVTAPAAPPGTPLGASDKNVFARGDALKAWTYDPENPLGLDPYKKKKKEASNSDPLKYNALNVNPTDSFSEEPSSLTAQNSYVTFSVSTTVHRKNPVVIQSPIVGYDNSGKGFNLLSEAPNAITSEERNVANIVHQSGAPVVHIVVQGVIERLKWNPVLPTIDKYKNMDVVEMDRLVTIKAVRNAGGLPVIRMEFAILYAVSGIPEGYLVPIDPPAGLLAAGNETNSLELQISKAFAL